MSRSSDCPANAGETHMSPRAERTVSAAGVRELARRAGIDPGQPHTWWFAPRLHRAFRCRPALVFITDPPTDRSHPMATRNPHDRRDRPESPNGDYAFGTTRDPLANSTGLNAEDLDGLVRRKESRAFDAGQRSTIADHAAALQQARREAWEKGRKAGVADTLHALQQRVQATLQLADSAWARAMDDKVTSPKRREVLSILRSLRIELADFLGSAPR